MAKAPVRKKSSGRRKSPARRRRPAAPDETAPTEAVDVTEAGAAEPIVHVGEEELTGQGPPPLRVAFIAGASVLAAAIMSGGIFLGIAPRITAAAAGFLGIVIAVRASNIKRQAYAYIFIVLGLVAIVFLVTLPAGISAIAQMTSNVRKAASAGNLLRPPVDFIPGWRPILGLLMAMTGFAAAWAGIEMRRPALALAIPIPVIAISAISVPDTQQIATGLVCLALFGVGLGILSGTESEGRKVSLAYELRRAARAVPLIGVITLVMYLLAQTSFLFPKPLYDPAQQAQKPKAVPLTAVPDRVLFRVDSTLTGPWQMGALDVYDGHDWRLPPFAKTRFVDVPSSGIVDQDLSPAVKANVEIVGLSGAVLPGLSNLVGVAAEGPKLVFDRRTQNIRIKQGQVQAGLKYTLVGSSLPSVQQLRVAPATEPPDVK